MRKEAESGRSSLPSDPTALTTRVRLGAFELDLEKRRLTREGALVPLTPKPLRVLSDLVVNRQRVVSRSATPETEAALIAHCRERLIKWSCPREIQSRVDLPKTRIGKIDHRSLGEGRSSEPPGRETPS